MQEEEETPPSPSPPIKDQTHDDAVTKKTWMLKPKLHAS